MKKRADLAYPSEEVKKQIIAEHYRLRRTITNAELRAECDSLRRKQAKGSLDDLDEILAARLRLLD